MFILEHRVVVGGAVCYFCNLIGFCIVFSFIFFRFCWSFQLLILHFVYELVIMN